MNFIIQKLKSKHTSLKKYKNWDKLSCLSLYIFLVLRERVETKTKYSAPKHVVSLQITFIPNNDWISHIKYFQKWQILTIDLNSNKNSENKYSFQIHIAGHCVNNQILWSRTREPLHTDYRHPETAFFSKLPNLLRLGQTNWANTFCGILGTFDQTTAPLPMVLSMCFFKKTLVFRPKTYKSQLIPNMYWP